MRQLLKIRPLLQRRLFVLGSVIARQSEREEVLLLFFFCFVFLTPLSFAEVSEENGRMGREKKIMRFAPRWKISHRLEFNSRVSEHIITTYCAAGGAVDPDGRKFFLLG